MNLVYLRVGVEGAFLSVLREYRGILHLAIIGQSDNIVKWINTKDHQGTQHCLGASKMISNGVYVQDPSRVIPDNAKDYMRQNWYPIHTRHEPLKFFLALELNFLFSSLPQYIYAYVYIYIYRYICRLECEWINTSYPIFSPSLSYCPKF